MWCDLACPTVLAVYSQPERRKRGVVEAWQMNDGLATMYLGFPVAAAILAEVDMGLRLPALDTGLGT